MLAALALAGLQIISRLIFKSEAVIQSMIKPPQRALVGTASRFFFHGPGPRGLGASSDSDLLAVAAMTGEKGETPNQHELRGAGCLRPRI
jgi:hypothetical protein